MYTFDHPGVDVPGNRPFVTAKDVHAGASSRRTLVVVANAAATLCQTSVAISKDGISVRSDLAELTSRSCLGRVSL